MTPPDQSPTSIDAGALRAAVAGKRILVGVTGGIAAYKTATVVSRLAQAGAEVTVAMTPAATHFVTPLTFQALSGRPVYTSAWEHIESSDPQHISLATGLAAALVAPCTMDCLAKLATGRTDDVVTLILSAVDREVTPVLLAPSMNKVMWSQKSTQRNVAQVVEDGFELVGPDDGWQACRQVGTGRMSEPEALIAAVARAVLLRATGAASAQGSPPVSPARTS
ncbi:MAG: flavoprotein [Phycisphaerales bacterium]|jgi:phosphopantothenoylcysteine decarboxylase/phosphopantothenate--cysteine ligase